VEAVKGSQIDCCGYPLSGLPREPPGVRVPLQLHHRRLGQHSPVHSSSVVGDPWRPDSHLPTPAPPSPFQTERSLGWCALWAPPFTRAVAPPPRPRARAGSRAGQRSARPGAPPPAVPQRRGRMVQSTTTPPVPRAVRRCGPPQSSAQGARPRASCSRGAAGSMSMTGRRRVQSEHSPGGLSVRLPWPPCRGLEHQASHNPPHAPPPPTRLHHKQPGPGGGGPWFTPDDHTNSRDATTSGDTDGPSRSGGNQKHWSGTGASGQGQARRSRVTRHALRAPPACTPRPPAPRAPHTQARRHLPPVCATTGYGGGQQSGRPWDRTTAIRLAQSCRHKGEC
jgi:hypothetical protein